MKAPLIIFLGLALSFLGVLEAKTGKFPSAAQVKESNAIGQIIANRILKIIADLGDPFVVLGDEGIVIPVNISDAISIQGDIKVSNIQVGGQSGLNITNSLAQATLIPVGVNINTLTFYLPELTITGEYVIDLLETSLINMPIYGAGPFSLKISSTALDLNQMKVRVKLDGHLEMTSLTYAIDIYHIGFRIDGLLSDVDPAGELNEAVNTLVNAYATVLFNMWEANLHDPATELIVDVANQVLANLTLADIIGSQKEGSLPVIQLTQ